MDLTKIREPFGLLDDETQAALKAHGGPYEIYNGYGWLGVTRPNWAGSCTYRVKPQPVRGCVWLVGSCAVGFSDTPYCEDTHRLTLPTQDGELIPGTYTGPDGATVKIEML